MVTCLSETMLAETCYHFALIFAKLFTASRFSRKERIRKTLPLSTIVEPNRENCHFSPFGEKWRLRWNPRNFKIAKSRFLRNPATSRGKFHNFRENPILTTSSGVKFWSRYWWSKNERKNSTLESFPSQKIFQPPSGIDQKIDTRLS